MAKYDTFYNFNLWTLLLAVRWNLTKGKIMATA